MQNYNFKKKKRLSESELIELFVYHTDNLTESGKLLKLKNQIHHKGISCFDHSLAVAFVSLKIANFFKIDCDIESLIKGAFLHDYFLYDWHIKGNRKFHGFTHAKVALNNAANDFEINKIEKDIIKKHMFPLNITPPRYKESYIVCLADKICATGEILLKRCKTSKLFEY